MIIADKQSLLPDLQGVKERVVVVGDAGAPVVKRLR